MLDNILANAPIYLLIAVRCLASLFTLPLFSTQSVSRVAKFALAGYLAFLLLPSAYNADYKLFVSEFEIFTLQYILLLVGEALIGIITGFFITILFATFSSAGQFFSFQMGLSAAEAYDSLSQVENPLMGQLLNLIAMLLFLQVNAFQQLFLKGFQMGFSSFNALTLINVDSRMELLKFLLTGLSNLFFNAMMIALPLVGSFFLVSVSMGILSKAAPQMNLLSEGIPLTMLLGFFLLTVCLPYMCDFFMHLFDVAFFNLEKLFLSLRSV